MKLISKLLILALLVYPIFLCGKWYNQKTFSEGLKKGYQERIEDDAWLEGEKKYVTIDASGKYFTDENKLDKEMIEIAHKYGFEIFEYSIYDAKGNLIKCKGIVK